MKNICFRGILIERNVTLKNTSELLCNRYFKNLCNKNFMETSYFRIFN